MANDANEIRLYTVFGVFFRSACLVIRSGIVKFKQILYHSMETGLVVRAFAFGAVDSGLIPNRVKPTTLIAIHSFLA